MQWLRSMNGLGPHVCPSCHERRHRRCGCFSILVVSCSVYRLRSIPALGTHICPCCSKGRHSHRRRLQTGSEPPGTAAPCQRHPCHSPPPQPSARRGQPSGRGRGPSSQQPRSFYTRVAANCITGCWKYQLLAIGQHKCGRIESCAAATPLRFDALRALRAASCLLCVL